MQNNCTNQTPEYAGFWVRLSAYVIDMAIIAIPLLLLRLILWGFTLGLEGTFFVQEILFQYTLSDIIVYLAQVTYFIVSTYTSGMTLGKRVLKLRVIDSENGNKPQLMDIIFRETVGRFLNGFFFSLGYLFVGLDHEKRGFHDFLSDTRVVYVSGVKSESYVGTSSEENKSEIEDEIAEIQSEERPFPQTYSFVPEQVSDVPEEELWHMPQAKTEEPKEENKVTYSWNQFEYVEEDNKKED